MSKNWRASVAELACLAGCMVVGCGGAFSQGAAPSTSDNPVYTAFQQLEKAPAYHVRLTLQSNDPQMAQAAAMGLGFGAIDKVVKGGTSQVIMHMKMPAMDVPGQVDDWEIRAVARNGKAARMFSSPAIPRLKKLQEENFTMQMAMLDKEAGMAIVQALAQGPVGGIRAAMIAGETIAFNALAKREFKKAEAFWDWKCLDQPGGGGAQKSPAELTDVKAVADETINGRAASAYDFFVNDNGQRQGPVHLLVAKESGLPARIHLNDPNGRGSVDMDYDLETSGEIEVPKCLSGGQ